MKRNGLGALFGVLLLAGCSGDDWGAPAPKDYGGGAAPEARIPCEDAAECDDANPCTIDDCHEGFCDYRSLPIDDDLDGYVSHVCGGPDCDDEDGGVHPGILEAPYDEEVCFDGVDNNCNALVDEEDAGCFHCQTAGDCDDGNPCTQQACVEGRCAYTNRPGPCDDGNACTVNDACFGGICTGDPLDADGDGYTDAACGGEDCDDVRAEVHPGAREALPTDPSCVDGEDNDCDGLTDDEEIACQEGNQVVRMTLEEEVAPAWTDLEIALTVGTFQEQETIRISYTGEAEAVYVTSEGWVRVEPMVFDVETVSASILIPLGTLTVRVGAFRMELKDPEDLILDPEGRYTANIRLRVDALVTARLGVPPIVQDYPMVLVSDDLSVSGQWSPLGDTDGDGRDEYDLLVDGGLSYGFPPMEVPLLGQVAATIGSDVHLGFRGEAL